MVINDINPALLRYSHTLPIFISFQKQQFEDSINIWTKQKIDGKIWNEPESVPEGAGQLKVESLYRHYLIPNNDLLNFNSFNIT